MTNDQDFGETLGVITMYLINLILSSGHETLLAGSRVTFQITEPVPETKSIHRRWPLRADKGTLYLQAVCESAKVNALIW